MENTLTIKQREAIPIILSSPTLDEAAKKIGVEPRTIYRWKNQPEFQIELQKVERIRLQEINAKSICYEEEALESLVDVMRNPTQEGANTKMRAAQIVFKITHRNLESLLLDQRLERIEGLIDYELP
jgi:transposase